MAAVAVEPERAEQLDALAQKIEFAANEAPELVNNLEAVKQQVLSEPPGELVLDDASVIGENLELAQLMGIVVPPDVDPAVLQHFFGDRRHWQERLKRNRTTATNKTVGYQLERFLDEQRHRQKPHTYKELARNLRRLLKTNVWAAETSVDSIDEQTVSRHYLWLVSQDFAPSRHNKLLGFFRRFVEWLWGNGFLADRPRNLKRRDHRKKIKHRDIRRHAPEKVKKTVESLPWPYNLWALLGLNCGMTERDLGMTEWRQINQKQWTLTRRRGKLEDNPKAPTVTYKLWPETIAELKRLPHRSGLLFITSTGQPYYETKFGDNNEASIKDLFSTYWRRIEPKPDIALGSFRSIGATGLKSDKLFAQYKDYFLANVPSGIADRHYSAESDEPFFEALDHIRRYIGFGNP